MARLVPFMLAATAKPVFINVDQIAWILPEAISCGRDGHVSGVGIEMTGSDPEDPYPSFVTTEPLEDVIQKINA